MDATIKIVHDHADRIFLWDYDRSRPQLVTLYNKAMGSQWNSVTELDWATVVDPEQLVDTQNPTMRLRRAAAELKERQEFLVENTLRNKARSATPEVWERVGVDLASFIPYIVEASQAVKIDPSPTSPRHSSRSSCPTCASWG